MKKRIATIVVSSALMYSSYWLTTDLLFGDGRLRVLAIGATILFTLAYCINIVFDDE